MKISTLKMIRLSLGLSQTEMGNLIGDTFAIYRRKEISDMRFSDAVTHKQFLILLKSCEDLPLLVDLIMSEDAKEREELNLQEVTK